MRKRTQQHHACECTEQRVHACDVCVCNVCDAWVTLQVRLRGRELQREGGEQVVVGGGESKTFTYRDGMAINRHVRVGHAQVEPRKTSC